MNGMRDTARWLGIIAATLGTIAIVAIVVGDIRAAFGWAVGIAAVGLVFQAFGGYLAKSRPVEGSGLLLVGTAGVLIGQWNEIARWSMDLWTSATGGAVSYVWQGVTYTPDLWGVLFGSVAMLGYAGAIILGAIATVIAFLEPEEGVFESQPLMHGSRA